MSAAGARDLGPAAGATASTAMEVPRSFADSALALALWLPRRALRLVELLGVFVACVIGIVLSGYGYARTVFAARRNKQAIPAEVVDATEKLRAQLASSSTRGDGPLISVVIPARNEAGHIAGTLARAETAALLPERVEVIVADAGCADNTTEVVSKLLTSFASVRVVEAESGRASALNAGAASARAPVLLFLHADTLLPEGWDVDVAANAAAPGVVAGAFSFSVNRGSFGGAEVPVGIGTMSAFANLRARMFQLPYGDQAMWMTAARFAAVGGFPPVAMMEDFEQTRALREAALREGGRVVILKSAAACSGRRWQRNGVLLNTLKNQWYVFAYTTLGWSADDIYERYYSEPVRAQSK